MKTMIHRRQLREAVLQALYAHQQSGDSPQHVVDTFLREHLDGNKEDRRFGEKLFFRTLEHQDHFNELIASQIRNWNMDRLATIDRIILRMSLCEFIHFEDIPTKVTMNEAIEIAKKFSTAKSGRFVNGILDALLLKLTNESKIQKKGRGLIERSHGK